MEAAHAWGVPPTVYLGRRVWRDRWLDRDRALAEAFLLHKAGVCSGCGHHMDDTGIRAVGDHEVKERPCLYCRSIADHDRFHHKKDGRPAWLKIFVRKKS